MYSSSSKDLISGEEKADVSISRFDFDAKKQRRTTRTSSASSSSSLLSSSRSLRLCCSLCVRFLRVTCCALSCCAPPPRLASVFSFLSRWWCNTAALSFFVAEKCDGSIEGRYVCFLWRSINTVIYNRDHICSRHIQRRQKKTKYEIKTKHQA